jgi:ribosomal protein L37AE/L43A
MKNIPRTGKRDRPKTAIKGKRYRCATCHKRSPRPVKTPAPWYCPKCAAAKEEAFLAISATPERTSIQTDDGSTPDSST